MELEAHRNVEKFKQENPSKSIFEAFYHFFQLDYHQREAHIKAIKSLYDFGSLVLTRTKVPEPDILQNHVDEQEEFDQNLIPEAAVSGSMYASVVQSISASTIAFKESNPFLSYPAKISSSTPIPSSSRKYSDLIGRGIWKYQDDEGNFRPYKRHISDTLEERFRKFNDPKTAAKADPIVKFSIDSRQYSIDLRHFVGFGFYFQKLVTNPRRSRRVQRVVIQQSHT
eukprot:TRINITY_DN18908_c0_g1_i1.p1 TRINITY_DN18908_c0_g1~~TRINITY_DN18908_c0_g1_i1.p1  ORF type:complete len:226 (+),score=21.96 TRINITY_DN18908_c0_g1_i1:66-743(+)